MRKAVNDTKPTILFSVILYLCNLVYEPTEEKLGDDYFMFMTVYHCINVTPKARQMRFSGSWYYAHVGTLLNCPLRHLAQILPDLADFSRFIVWFRISTRRIRGGNVRFVNASSNERLRDCSFILCVSPYFPIFFPFRFSLSLRTKPF